MNTRLGAGTFECFLLSWGGYCLSGPMIVGIQHNCLGGPHFGKVVGVLVSGINRFTTLFWQHRLPVKAALMVTWAVFLHQDLCASAGFVGLLSASRVGYADIRIRLELVL